MFLNISSLVVAALFGIALIAALRLSNENDRLRNKLKETQTKLYDRILTVQQLDNTVKYLCDANESENATYFVGYKNDSVSVLRRCFVNGCEYHTFIKGFNDEDAEFNLREADELCETLNS